MQTELQRGQINKVLRENGFAQLHESGLLTQIAFLIQNHQRFRQLLMTVEPDKRRQCYDALAPKLHFKAYPLDTYVSQAAQNAEMKQLPIYDYQTGDFRDFEVQNIITQANQGATPLKPKTEDGVAVLRCRRCTREETFEAATPIAARIKARDGGWRYDLKTDSWSCGDCLK